MAFLNAQTPKAFVEFWSPQNRDRFESLIGARFTETSKRDAVLHAFRKSRHRTFSKLKTVRQRHRGRRIKSYLTAQTQYEYVAQLWRVGRIFPVRGDLTATTTMRQIADRLRLQNRKLGLLYLSNCEQYFAELPPAYRANIVRLPTDERSLVLRTRPWLEKLDRSGADKSMPRTCANCKTRGRLNYTYMYQTIEYFKTWLDIQILTLCGAWSPSVELGSRSVPIISNGCQVSAKWVALAVRLSVLLHIRLDENIHLWDAYCVPACCSLSPIWWHAEVFG